jgi:hypothetical protein
VVAQFVSARGSGLRVGPSLRVAAALAVPDDTITDCLDLSQPGDVRFRQAWRHSLASLPRAHRGGALSAITGHVAESVAAVQLADLGYQLIWQLTGPGHHGVDLVMLDPAGQMVVAWEVKGTLREVGWPRLSGRELGQMGAGWMDKADNPGMTEWGLTSADVIGGVVFIRFRTQEMRILVTADYATLLPITDKAQLADLSWIVDV